MNFLIGSMKHHINGHKELTSYKDVVPFFNSSKLYIPLFHANAKIEVLVEEGAFIKVGTLLAQRNDHFYVPFYSSCSGTFKGIEKRAHSSGKMIEHLVIENDQKFEEEQNLSKLDYKKASIQEIVDFIKEKGIVGQGGAGFPTYIKYNGAKGIHTLIINAVECEPYITADYVSMINSLEFFKDGLLALLKASTANVCKLCIKEDKKDLINKLKDVFKENPEVLITPVPNVYPMGWERTLIYQVTKKRYEKLPSELGVIVSNATSAIAFGKALNTGIPITTSVVTFSGDAINNPSNVVCPIGTVVSEVIDSLGGLSTENAQIISGGPMMGSSLSSDAFVVAPTTNAITLLKYNEVKELDCLRCGLCVDNCPSGLQPVNLNQAEKTKDIEALEKLRYDQCIECGLCTYVCPSKRSVTEGIRRAKRYMALKKK